MIDQAPALSAKFLLPFVPAKDYELSKAFYLDLGFSQAYQDDQLTEYVLNDCRFYLQNFFEQSLANHFVLQLLVQDLDAWWARIQSQQLDKRYPGVRLHPPETKAWGQRILTLIDPSGVLWYLA
ncbi:MAG TPA: hypothetical protein V6D23_07585 [Candidatus Obscuribacterales bacterium]